MVGRVRPLAVAAAERLLRRDHVEVGLETARARRRHEMEREQVHRIAPPLPDAATGLGTSVLSCRIGPVGECSPESISDT